MDGLVQTSVFTTNINIRVRSNKWTDWPWRTDYFSHNTGHSQLLELARASYGSITVTQEKYFYMVKLFMGPCYDQVMVVPGAI